MNFPSKVKKTGNSNTDRSIRIFFICSLVLAIFLSWQVVLYIKVQLDANIEENIEKVLQTTHGSIQNWVNGRVDGAKSIADRSDFQELIIELHSSFLSEKKLVDISAFEDLHQIVKPWIDRHKDRGVLVVNPDRSTIIYNSNKELELTNSNFSPKNHIRRLNFNFPKQTPAPFFYYYLPADVRSKSIANEPAIYIDMPVKNGY